MGIYVESLTSTIAWTQSGPVDFNIGIRTIHPIYWRGCVEVWTQTLLPYYGSLIGAESYFNTRLHTNKWRWANRQERQASLYMATRAIDVLHFKGHKADPEQPLFFPRTIDVQPHSYSHPSVERHKCGWGLGCDCDWCGCLPNAIRVSFSNLTTGCNPFGFPPICIDPPPHGIPRVPGDIEVATYEIALAFLNGVNMDTEARNLSVTSQGYSGARTSYDRSFTQDHIRAGIPSAYAWSILRPYLADPQAVHLVRRS